MHAKLNLTLLNRLVKELNDAASACNGLDDKTSYDTYVVELAKLIGLMTGVSIEAMALVKDATKLVQENSLPPQGTEDLISEIFGGLGSSYKKKLD